MKLNSALPEMFSVFLLVTHLDRIKDYILSIYDIQCSADNKGM